MKVILFFAALFLSGPGAEAPRGFDSMEKCEAVRAKLPAVVAQYNATDADNKIVSFAAVCAELKPAKQGIDG